MDQNRQIRFLIPPFLLLASLFLGDFVSCSNIINKIAEQPDKNILAIVAALGGSTIPIGFLIASIPIAVLNFIGFVCCRKKSKWNYELSISPKALKMIWPKLETSLKFDFQKRFYAGVTFDHDILPLGIHQWLYRRWNAFNICINCCAALLLSHAIGYFLLIRQTFYWWIVTTIIFLFMFFNAMVAWRQTMQMIEFQAFRNFEKKGSITGKILSQSQPGN